MLEPLVLMAGCALFLDHLWEVTDYDIVHYIVLEALLSGWLGTGTRESILFYVKKVDQAPGLTHLIGAVPVACGLPVSLQ